jgi:thymidylate synthase
MKQYLDLLQNILDNGVEKESGRANMPNTIGISNGIIKMNLQDGFPLLTTKKMYLKGIIHELLWILNGDTNIKYLVDNDVNIWSGDAYRWYLKHCTDNNIDVYFDTIEKFVDFIREIKGIFYDSMNNVQYEIRTSEPEIYHHLLQLNAVNYIIGDLGKVYGYQWRNQNGVDQVKEVLDGLKTNPYSRYHILDGWNKADFKDMALPPCHLLYQFIVRPLSATQREDFYAKLHDFNEEQRLEMNPNATDGDVHKIYDEEGIPRYYLDLNMYQRSVDTFLGASFNLASMSLLLMIFAKTSNMIPGVATWMGGDTHIYLDHIPMVKEQLTREPYPLPKLIIKKELNGLDDILALTIEDFELIGYESHSKIKGELFTGLKK